MWIGPTFKLYTHSPATEVWLSLRYTKDEPSSLLLVEVLEKEKLSATSFKLCVAPAVNIKVYSFGLALKKSKTSALIWSIKSEVSLLLGLLLWGFPKVFDDNWRNVFSICVLLYSVLPAWSK